MAAASTGPGGRDAAGGAARLAVAQWGDGLALGGLAVACVRVDERAQEALLRGELADPERIAPAQLAVQARRVAAVVPVEVVDLSARKYNSVMRSAGSEGRVLDWAYRKSIEGLAVRYPLTGLLVHDWRAPAFALVEGDVRGTSRWEIRFVAGRERDLGTVAAALIARSHYAAALRRCAGALERSSVRVTRGRRGTARARGRATGAAAPVAGATGTAAPAAAPTGAGAEAGATGLRGIWESCLRAGERSGGEESLRALRELLARIFEAEGAAGVLGIAKREHPEVALVLAGESVRARGGSPPPAAPAQEPF